MNHTIIARRMLLLLILLLPVPAHAQMCGTERAKTGLDPTEFFSAAKVSIEGRILTPSARQTVQKLSLTRAFNAKSSVELAVPYRESLRINGVGSATGIGDAVIRYSHLLSCGGRWRTAAAVQASFYTGSANFTNGALGLSPSAAVSYHAFRWMDLVLIPSYDFPLRTRADFPLLRSGAITARAIIAIPQGVYASAGFTHQHVTGTYRYGADSASFTVGAVLATRYNIGVFYEMPATNFTYALVQQSAMGVRLSLQR